LFSAETPDNGLSPWSSCPPKEVVERFANVARTFEKGEISGVSKRDQASIRNGLRDLAAISPGMKVV